MAFILRVRTWYLLIKAFPLIHTFLSFLTCTNVLIRKLRNFICIIPKEVLYFIKLNQSKISSSPNSLHYLHKLVFGKKSWWFKKNHEKTRAGNAHYIFSKFYGKVSNLKKICSKLRFWPEKLNCRFILLVSLREKTPKTTFLPKFQCRK